MITNEIKINLIRNIYIFFAIITILTGVSVMFGWVFDISILKAIIPGTVEMKFNTAITFCITGFVIISQYKFLKISKFLAFMVIAIAATTMFQDISGINLNIDQLIMHEPESAIFTVHPGRMSIITAICFISINFTLISSNIFVGQLLSIIVATLSYFSIVGYLLDVKSINVLNSVFTAMAVNTSILFFLLSIGSFFARFKNHIIELFFSETASGIILRRLIPLTLILPLFFAWVDHYLAKHQVAAPNLLSSMDAIANILIMLIVLLFTNKKILEIELQKTNANKKISELEKKFTSFYQYSPVANIITSIVDDKYIEVNNKFIEEIGYSRNEIIGKSTNEVIIFEDNNEYDRILFKIMANKGCYGEEIKIRSKSGEVLDYYTSVNVIEIDGKPHFLSSLLNITKQKKAQESQRHLSEIVDKSLNEIYIFDAKSLQFKHINRGALLNLQYTFEEIKQMKAFEIKPDFSEQSFRDKISPLLQNSDEVLIYETVHKRADSSIYPVEVHLQLIENEFLAVVTDITQRKKVEFELMAEKERLSVTLRSISDGVIATDLEGKIIVMNNVAEKLTEWTQDEAYQTNVTNVFDIINETNREKISNPFAQVIQSSLPFESSSNLCLISKSKNEITIEFSAAPILDNTKNIIGVVIVFRDTKDKQKLIASEQRTAKLEALGILAGGIAHDFNNLLGGLFGYLEMAFNNCPENSISSEYITKALYTFNRAKDLTKQLLTFSKGGEPVKKISPLSPLIKDSTHFAMSGSNVSCIFDIDNDLWDCEFDENQICQVIDNLVINAKQAMPDGGTLTVGAKNIIKENKNFVQISFKDTGEGIPPQLVSRIFDPFFTTKSKGTGLGLSTAYSIMKKHYGEITVESEVQKGSTFTLLIPSIGSSTLTNNRTDDIENVTSITKNKRNAETKHILILEDEDFMREIIEHMLKSLGFQVIITTNGQDALDIIANATSANTNIVAAIFDLTIPGGMGGKETINKLRSTGCKIPVYVSSGYSDDPIMANPQKYGFTDKISKPFRKHDLSKLLKTLF